MDMWTLDHKQRLPLFYASFRGLIACVAFLLGVGREKKKAEIEHRDLQGDTALHAACVCGVCVCVCVCVCEVLPERLATYICSMNSDLFQNFLIYFYCFFS